MSAEQLVSRILSERTGVRSDAMRRGEISDDEFDRIFEATRALSQLPLFVDDSPAFSVSQMRTRARRLKRQHGLSLTVVPYTQLMQPPPGKSRDTRIQENPQNTSTPKGR